MIAYRVIAVGGLCVLLLLTSTSTTRAEGVDPCVPSDLAARSSLQSVAGLIERSVRASGVEDRAEIARDVCAFQTRLLELERRVGHPRSIYRRGRRLHDALHDHVFLRYNPQADGIGAILDHGEFNCVSATIFWGIAARAFGLDVKILESPRHIFLRLPIEYRDVDIECTARDGYDIRRDLESFRRFAIAYKYATPEEMERRGPYAMFEEFHGIAEPVSLEQAEAFIWHNTAERALARGEPLKAAEATVEEYHHYPELVTRSEGTSSALAGAFRFEYEDGRFDTAWRIASMEREIFPTRTTTRDRLLAAATKRIERATESGDPTTAETILDETEALLIVPGDTQRLERENCPHIVAAAVRGADWERARRMVARFAKSEPDEVESERLLAWVESRENGEALSGGGDLCMEGPHRTGAGLTHITAHP